MPLVRQFHECCFSSRSFLSEIKDRVFTSEVQSEVCLVTADVVALYPSIPHDLVIIAIRETCVRYNYYLSEVNLFCDLANWILSNNFCQFEDQVYLQIKGTAMGTPAAVCIANIVMEYLEHKIMIRMQSLCPNANFTNRRLLYRRYIDDIFSVWSHESVARIYFKYFNLCCQDIQLILDFNQKAVFLDLNIWVKDNKLCTSLYQKPLCKFLYIVPTSQHQHHVFSSFIVSETKRYRLACSEDSDFLSMQLKFVGRLARRGYPFSLITLVWSCTRATLTFPNPNPNPTPIATSPYSADRSRFTNSPVVAINVPRLHPPILWRSFFEIPVEITSLVTYKNIWSNNVIVVHKGQPKFSFYLTRSLFQRIDGEELSTRRKRKSSETTR